MPGAGALSGSATGARRVGLTSLRLTDLRNYATLQLQIGARLIVLTGPNGAGKTNLLEAVSLLSPGRGLRRAAFDEITRAGTTAGWAVSAVLDRDGEETRVGTGLAGGVPGQEGTRKVRINGAPAPSAEALLQYLRLLWLTPSMDALLTGPASERRRFLDRLVLAIDPQHGARVRDFERLLTQRNRLLEQGAASAWLDALEAELAGHAVAVAVAREQAVALLSARIARRSASGPSFPAGEVSLCGEFESSIERRSAAQSELAYRSLLRGSRVADRAAGRTLVGPHRGDLQVIFAEKKMPAARSSTGEQKALLIGLLLAHAEIVAEISGLTPVLLLDEVVAHLDPQRRVALFDRLAELGFQCFMTGADPALFSSLSGQAAHFEIVGGALKPV